MHIYPIIIYLYINSGDCYDLQDEVKYQNNKTVAVQYQRQADRTFIVHRWTKDSAEIQSP